MTLKAAETNVTERQNVVDAQVEHVKYLEKLRAASSNKDDSFENTTVLLQKKLLGRDREALAEAVESVESARKNLTTMEHDCELLKSKASNVSTGNTESPNVTPQSTDSSSPSTSKNEVPTPTHSPTIDSKNGHITGNGTDANVPSDASPPVSDKADESTGSAKILLCTFIGPIITLQQMCHLF